MSRQLYPSIKIDPQRCKLCYTCVSVCPSKIFIKVDNRVETQLTSRCIKCGHCVAVCDTGAIVHEALPLDEFEEAKMPAPDALDYLVNLFKTRRTCRNFVDEPLQPSEIDKLIEVARFAPTATNAQNLKYLAFTDKKSINDFKTGVVDYFVTLEKQLNNPFASFAISLSQGKKLVDTYKYHLSTITDLFSEVKQGKDRIFYQAPAVLVGFAPGVLHMALAGGNLFAMQLMLAAHAMGLGTCYGGYALIALVRNKKLRQKIGIPKGYHPACVIALGKPDVHFHLIPPRRKPRMV